jgi:hypothetical protein
MSGGVRNRINLTVLRLCAGSCAWGCELKATLRIDLEQKHACVAHLPNVGFTSESRPCCDARSRSQMGQNRL